MIAAVSAVIVEKTKNTTRFLMIPLYLRFAG
jgi:hypothetical protein